MFRNRFTSYSYRQNYIRRPQSKSTDNKKDTKINGEYWFICFIVYILNIQFIKS